MRLAVVIHVSTMSSLCLGGLAFTPKEIGNALGFSSLPLIVLSVFLFPFLERTFGSKKVQQYTLQLLQNVFTFTVIVQKTFFSGVQLYEPLLDSVLSSHSVTPRFCG